MSNPFAIPDAEIKSKKFHHGVEALVKKYEILFSASK